jgi:hypothetical protein
MIVKPSDFQGGISIGQVGQPDVAAHVQWYIDKYEPLYLRGLLGNELAQLLESEYAKEQPEQKWIDLANEAKKSCALYVYYMYLKGNVTTNDGVGEVLNKSENAVNMPVVDKMVTTWNEMVKYNLEFRAWVDKGIYPEYAMNDVFIYRTTNAFGI